MKQKGKFKLLSYLIEDYIIFYKSLNKNKKILAFSLFKIENYEEIIPILNKFLNNDILNYYSIQFDAAGVSEPLILLNFEDRQKKVIIKLFQLVYQELVNIKNLHFLRDQDLENDFLSIFIDKIDPNLKISKINHSLKLESDGDTKIFELFSINLSGIKNHISFILNFLKFSRDYKRPGYLILNFKKDLGGKIVLAPYFIHIGKDNKNLNKIEIDFNRLYDKDLIKKQNLDLHNFFCILWRTDVFYTTIPILNISKMFKFEDKRNFFNISSFNLYFEELLNNNQIDYKTLNQNLFFIEDNILFFVFSQLDSKLILGILKKYLEKYFIYILILDETDCAKILQIKEINMLKNVKILCQKELKSFNVGILKTKY